MPSDRHTTDTGPLLAAAAALRAGDDAAADRLAAALRPFLNDAAAGYLGPGHPDVDDVVQDATLSALRYLGGDAEFEGDPIRLAVTIARNRCRDLHRWRRIRPETEVTAMADWLDDGRGSALDELLEQERAGLVQRALDALSDGCRRLLHALYVAGLPTETVRRKLGLGTVQGVYYRRGICLGEAKKFLQKSLHDRSGDGRVGGSRQRPRPER